MRWLQNTADIIPYVREMIRNDRRFVHLNPEIVLHYDFDLAILHIRLIFSSDVEIGYNLSAEMIRSARTNLTGLMERVCDEMFGYFAREVMQKINHVDPATLDSPAIRAYERGLEAGIMDAIIQGEGPMKQPQTMFKEHGPVEDQEIIAKLLDEVEQMEKVGRPQRFQKMGGWPMLTVAATMLAYPMWASTEVDTTYATSPLYRGQVVSMSSSETVYPATGINNPVVGVYMGDNTVQTYGYTQVYTT